jgi:hypothetical protein
VAPTSLLLPTSLRRRCGSPAGPFPPSKELAAFSPCYYGGCVLQSAVQCSACVFPIFGRPSGKKIRKLVCCSTAAPVVSPVSHGAGRIRDPRGQPSSPPPGSPVPSAAGASRPLGLPLPVTTGCSAPDPATSFLLSFFRNTGSPGGSGLRQPRQGRILSPSATMGLS